MSWGDIFFPGNPGRRQEVVSLSTQLEAFMESNFDATNDLIDLLNKDLTSSSPISKIYIDPAATVKDNCQTLLDKMNEITSIVDKIDAAVADELDPEAYRELKDPNLDFLGRIAAAEKAISSGLTILASVASVVILSAISSGMILVKMVAAIGVIKTCVVATVVLGVLTLGIDMIASAIMGAVEKDKLEDAIDDLEKAVETFRPASKQYTKNIIRAQVTLELELEGNS